MIVKSIDSDLQEPPVLVWSDSREVSRKERQSLAGLVFAFFWWYCAKKRRVGYELYRIGQKVGAENLVQDVGFEREVAD